MELPDLEGRKAILGVHLKRVKHDNIDIGIVACATAGSSGAELANIVNEAALRAVRMGRDSVTTADLEESVETETAADIDREVLGIIRNAHEKAREIISANRDIMDEASDFLVTRETITGEEFMEIVRRHSGDKM